MKRAIVGITMGDAAGIGPEIIVKALGEGALYEPARPLVIGDARVLHATIRQLNSPLVLNIIENPAQGLYRFGTMDLIDLANISMDRLSMGKVQASCGRAAYQYIEKAVELALEKKIHALATAPINKESLKAAAVPYIGHTEILAGLTHSTDPLTMFQVRNLRVFFLSRHVSLRAACDLVTKERVLGSIRRCTEALAQLGLPQGRLAVAGLNPHSGEHGLFGNEEQEAVVPAVEAAREEGISVEGPVSADSVFHLALQGRYDAVLSLYHDQGHIAVKTLDFERTISFTLGLPFLRTSVDHGTGFDIAGQGRAGAVSMTEAIRLAAEYGG